MVGTWISIDQTSIYQPRRSFNMPRCRAVTRNVTSGMVRRGRCVAWTTIRYVDTADHTIGAPRYAPSCGRRVVLLLVIFSINNMTVF